MRKVARWFGLGMVLALGLVAGAVQAQTSWVQIEAKPNRQEALASAETWARSFANVAGFALNSGWYAVALGPYGPETAAEQLLLLRREGIIPGDSYVATADTYGTQVWPAAGATVTPAPPGAADTPVPAGTPATAAPEATPSIAAALPDETPAEARASESRLSREARMALQQALKWQGHYLAAIDGAFGAGTRRSMADWQARIGVEPTGILTSAQRADLLARTEAERAPLGLRRVRDEEAGIELVMPAGLVAFDRYEPPFAVYGDKDGSGVQVLLISRQGDQTGLFGLYDLMQSFEVVPLDGARERSASGFVLTGQNARIRSHTEVGLRGGLIKGFTLVWPAGDDARMARVLAEMQASFTPFGTRAMDAALGEPVAVSPADLLSGLDVRRPTLTRSGFYLTDQGAVLTTADAAAGCGKVTVDGVAFSLAFDSAGLGISVLTPQVPLAPVAVAEFQTGLLRPMSEIAVAGYPYADALSAPVMTWGQLSAHAGLNGEPDIARLRLAALPGDAGGPVLDATGSVVGLLLAAEPGSRQLPQDLALARQAAALTPVLAQNGFAPRAASRSTALAAEDLARLARGLAVQVSCWN